MRAQRRVDLESSTLTHQRVGVEECPARRRGRPRSERAERAIIEAALDLLACHGVAGLSIEAVAQRAGVAKTTVYRRWARKYDLILDVIASVKGPVVRPPGGPVRDDLVFLLAAASRNSTRTRAGRLIAKLVGEARDHPELVDLFLRRIVIPRNSVIRQVLQRGAGEGLIRADADLDLAVQLLISPVIVRSCFASQPVSRERIEGIVDTVLAGLAPTAARP